MLQHDNARTHVLPDNEILLAVFNDYHDDLGWSFKLVPQPPNSPDMNILDLGFFAAIQSLQHRTSARTIDELVSNVLKAFQDYPCLRLERIFLSLQACLIETIKVFGDNSYKLPHLSKEKHARKGQLPENLLCPDDVYHDAMAKLAELDRTDIAQVFDDEVREAQIMIELSRELELVSLEDSESTEEVLGILEELDIEPIRLDSE